MSEGPGMALDGVDPLPHRGDGFLLRRLRPDDLSAFQAYRGDAELGRYQSWSPMTDEQAAAFLVEMSAAPFPHPGQWTQIAIADAGGAHLLGDLGVFVDANGRDAEIGFTLARHAQGRGVATAAVRDVIELLFAASGVRRIIGVTDARNSASVRLLERVGMRLTESRMAMFRGEECLEHVYAMVRDGSD